MIKLRTLLATALMLAFTGCASSVTAQVSTNDTKFLKHTDHVLGLTPKELKEALGSPEEIVSDDCIVPYQEKPGSEIIPVVGNTWLYVFEGDTSRATMIVCVVSGRAVAEQRHTMGIIESKSFRSTQEIVDHDLIEKAYKGELNDSPAKDETVPSYNGPEYEI